jgi:hypothetical protein
MMNTTFTVVARGTAKRVIGGEARENVLYVFGVMKGAAF